MSRSESLGCTAPPATNAWASTTERAPGGGAARSARRGASPRSGPPRGSGRAAPTARAARRGRGRGCRRPRPGRARPRAAPACRRAAASARMNTPAASISRELKPSRCAESWLPLVSTTRARDAASRARASSASRTASTWRQRPVVDVAGHHDEVDPLGGDDLEQVVDVRRLVGEHPLTVERPAEVPVGGVEDAHAVDRRRDRRQSGAPTPPERRGPRSRRRQV